MRDDKHFLVIGGTSGIGLELVRTLSETVTVSVWSRNKPDDLPAGVNHVRWDATADTETPAVPEELSGVAYCPGSIRLEAPSAARRRTPAAAGSERYGCASESAILSAETQPDTAVW